MRDVRGHEEADDALAGRRIQQLESELFAIRNSSTWQLTLRLQRVVAGLRRLVPGAPAHSDIDVVVESIGPKTALTIRIRRDRTPPGPLVLILSVGASEVLQAPIRLSSDDVIDGDISVTRRSETEWSVVWSPSTPLGDYEIADVGLRVGGHPHAVITYAPGARAVKVSAAATASARTTVHHLANSVQQIVPIDSHSELVPSGRVAILSTFTPSTRPLDAVVGLLRGLNASGYRTVVVDTSPEARLVHHPEIHELATHYVRRANIGWDFSSWMAVHCHNDLRGLVAEASEVLWVNDSCFGPLATLDPLLGDARQQSIDMWGLTSSHQISPHLQSYMLRFSRNALDNGLIDQFVDGYPFPTRKSEIIQAGEVGLTRLALESGLKVDAAFRYEDVAARYLADWNLRMNRLESDPVVTGYRSINAVAECRRIRHHVELRDDIENGVPRNSTHDMWDTLIEMGCPMLKRELVTSNPQNVPIHALWETLDRHAPEWTDTVRRELSLPS